MKRHRSDNNTPEIVTVLRDAGVYVGDLSQAGYGIPDKLLGFQGRTDIAEIKNGPLGWKYTDQQQRFRALWPGGRILTFENVDDVVQWLEGR